MPAMTSEEAYAILGVQKTANEIEIKTAYKRLALRIHPDKNPNDPDASKNFHRASEAYKRIIDPASFHDEDNEGEDISEAEMESVFNMMFSEMCGFGGSFDFFVADDDDDDDDDDGCSYERGRRAEDQMLHAMKMMLIGAGACSDNDSEDEEDWDEDEDEDEEDEDEDDENDIRMTESDMVRNMIQNFHDGHSNIAVGKSENLDTGKTVGCDCDGKQKGQKGKESASKGSGKRMGSAMNDIAAMLQMMEKIEKMGVKQPSKSNRNYTPGSKRKIDEEDSDEWETASDDDDDDDDDDDGDDDDDDDVDIEEAKEEAKIEAQRKLYKSNPEISKAAPSSSAPSSSSSSSASARSPAQKLVSSDNIVEGMKACSVSEGFKVGDRVMVNSR